MTEPFALHGATVFDGRALHEGLAVVVTGGRVTALLPRAEAPPGLDLGGGILAPGFIDLQVNGGGGRMLGEAPGIAEIAAICDAHLRAGTTGLLPTLITAPPEVTAAVVAAGIAATEAGVPGFLGLHLEGPHLDPRRAGAHDPALIRPMGAADADALIAARAGLPALIATLAPEAATPQQIARLAGAGILVSLGHSGCTFAEAQAAIAAGAGAVTHLFNAMSPLGHREPGLVGAALDADLPAGLIADGLHIAPAVLRIAAAAKRGGAERLFLVTDAMAPAGTALREFTLGGRRILRRGGRLTLADGTLAGADLTLPQAVARMVRDADVPVAAALAMATRVPADLVGRPDLGRIAPGLAADLVHLGADLTLRAVWQGGQPVAG